jgi:hypothetical protein
MGFASISDLVHLETQLRDLDPGSQRKQIQEKLLEEIGERLAEKLKLPEVKGGDPLPSRPSFHGKAREIVEGIAVRIDEGLAKAATRAAKAEAAAEALEQAGIDLDYLFQDQDERWEQLEQGLKSLQIDLGEDLGAALDDKFEPLESAVVVQEVAEIVIDFFDRSLPDHTELIREARLRLLAARGK